MDLIIRAYATFAKAVLAISTGYTSWKKLALIIFEGHYAF